MALPRLVCCLLSALASSVGIVAQVPASPELATGLAAAAAKIAAKDWAAALQLLLPLQERPGASLQRQQLASDLEDVAQGFAGEAAFDGAMRALAAAVVVQSSLHEGADDDDVARVTNDLGFCQLALGRYPAALASFEAALAMRQRLFGNGPHEYVAVSLNNVAYCMQSLGNPEAALPRYEAALAMRQQLGNDRDDAGVALARNNVGYCLQALGRPGEALPQFEAALAMRQRLFGDIDHADLAGSIHNVAHCLKSLGRVAEALPRFAAALAMQRRLHAGRDRPEVADALLSVADCTESLGRGDEALPQYREVLAIRLRLFGDSDHPDVARSMNFVASCLASLGRAQEALPQEEAALAMRLRLYGDRDHPDVATSRNCVADGLAALGRHQEALVQYEAALAMRRRLTLDRDHPDVVLGLHNVAHCLAVLGRPEEALPICERAVAMIERLRDTARTSGSLRQSLFDHMKRGGTFEGLQAVAVQMGRPADAVLAAERSRSRYLLDLIEEQGFDPFEEALRRAQQRGDADALAGLQVLRTELQAADLEADRLLRELTGLGEDATAAPEARRADVLSRSNANNERRRQLLDERARRLGDVLQVGRVRPVAEIRAALQPGELFVEYTIANAASLVYVLGRDGEVEALALPAAAATIERTLPALLRRASQQQLADRGRDPELSAGTMEPTAAARELFSSLVPPALWQRLRAARRVFVSPHRGLHRLPFELLVTDIRDGKPVYWLDDGPPVAYVQSGSVLHWLRRRAADAADDTTSLDVLAVGDPRGLEADPEVPVDGVFVVAVNATGEGARVGLLPGDVMTSYDGQPLIDDKSLRDLRTATEAAIEDGRHERAPIQIGIWRRGTALELLVQPGLLGIQVGPGRARAAQVAMLDSATRMEQIARAGDIERLGRLPPLRGARAETVAIADVFERAGRPAKCVLGDAATEPAVFDLAAKAKYLHFACHGVAEEYAGQSLSMLVLSQPRHVLPGDDGLLELGDLLQAWRGRLASCRLVVLSACRTNVGPTHRDDAPQALPVGFLFAGAPAVISSLWAVDDASTRLLMTDFYGRLLAGDQDRLHAFTQAKRALRAAYPDPFHWAPFLYVGSPE